MSPSIVDSLFESFTKLSNFLNEKEEFSLNVIADQNFTKSILLCSASYFENYICKLLLNYIDHSTKSNAIIQAFFKNKAISRQYHTYFDWDDQNGNRFYGLFGEDFKKYMQKEVKQDEKLDSAVKAFLEIGRERNRLIHQDYGNYYIEKTPQEIYKLYKTSVYFLEVFQAKLYNYTNDETQMHL